MSDDTRTEQNPFPATGFSIALGVDIVSVDRIEKALKRWGRRFLERCFTDWEIERFQHNPQSLAGRFAAKEALYKALATDETETIGWRDVEVQANVKGAPLLKLYRSARAEADKQGWHAEIVSISHDAGMVVAVVTALKFGEKIS